VALDPNLAAPSLTEELCFFDGRSLLSFFFPGRGFSFSVDLFAVVYCSCFSWTFLIYDWEGFLELDFEAFKSSRSVLSASFVLFCPRSSSISFLSFSCSSLCYSKASSLLSFNFLSSRASSASNSFAFLSSYISPVWELLKLLAFVFLLVFYVVNAFNSSSFGAHSSIVILFMVLLPAHPERRHSSRNSLISSNASYFC
jgi:hypothetical protein